MKYISIDIEATGLEENALIIEFAAVPIDADRKHIASDLAFHSYVWCPPFEKLKPDLNEWVIQNNESLINKANKSGLKLNNFRTKVLDYFNSSAIKNYQNDKYNNYTLLGKSMNSIDLPFLNRDLGWNTMKSLFHHQVLDVSSVVRLAIDLKKLPKECTSGSHLSNYLGFGEVDHTALEDAVVTAKIYFKLLEIIN
tara:strand:+ start:608 stop:1195 length:588 start_codon:yes stop_codon:yes gene_type:complete